MERKIKGGTVVGLVEEPKPEPPKEKAEKPTATTKSKTKG